jgi:ATP-dependent DNA helicase RecQ
MLAGRDHLSVLENFVYGDTPEQHGIRHVIDELVSASQGRAGSQWELLLNRLSQQSNIRPLPLKTLLVQLELRGIIAPRYSFFADYRFKLHEPPERLAERFQGERRDFVQAILDASNRARTWYSLDFAALETLGAERGLDTRRARVLTALEYFVEKGWLELESKQMTDVYKVRQPDIDASTLTDDLFAYFRHKEQSEVERLHAMLALFESDKCLSRILAEWFGDTRVPERCGHCSTCRGQVARLPVVNRSAALAHQDIEALCGPLLKRLTELGTDLPASADLLTRFLCGIPVPLFNPLKARRLPGFAALEDHAYRDVRHRVIECLFP